VRGFLLAANRRPHATRELFSALGSRLQREVERSARASFGARLRRWLGL